MTDTTAGVPAAGTPLIRRAQMAPPSAWFGVDALVTGVNGLGYLVLAGPVEDLLGPGRTTSTTIGVALVAFALAVAAVASPRGFGERRARAVVTVNAAWVLASFAVALLAPFDLTGAGRAWALLQAAVVAVLAEGQRRSLGPA